MTTPPGTDEDKSYGRLAYEAFHEGWPHDWDNAPDQRRWCRAGEAVARAQREASATNFHHMTAAERANEHARADEIPNRTEVPVSAISR